MKQPIVFALLATLGTFKAVADVAGCDRLSGFGASLNVSPAMKVFTAHRGFETHTNAFVLHAHWRDGSSQTLSVDKTLYRQLRGPYNRRNAHGAVIAYGPLLASNPLTQPMFEAGLQYSLCSPGVLLDEFGLRKEAALSRAVIELRPQQQRQSQQHPWRLELQCRGES